MKLGVRAPLHKHGTAAAHITRLGQCPEWTGR